MNSELLPYREEQKFDASKCFVTLEQIENLIAEHEEILEKLYEIFESEDGNNRRVTGDLIYRVEAKLSILKDIRHLAYVNGGYKKGE